MSFERVVEFARANHIQYLQLISTHLDPDAPAQETRRKLAILRQNGLIPYAFGVASTSPDPIANRRLFEFAELIGAKLIVVEPELADWDSLEALVKEYDINLAVHNHGRGTTYGDPKVIKKVLATRDARIGVCLDVGWITAAGFDAAQVFRDYGERVFDIHFKDKKLQPGRDAIDTVPGSGDANYAGLFAEIQRSAWSGVMAVETDSGEFAGNPQGFVTAASTLFNQYQEDWIKLFNGRDLTGWTPKITQHTLGENYASTFRVENSLLKVRYDGFGEKGFDRQFGHLFYNTPFSYYRLIVEYRFVGEQAPNGPGAWALRNSGVMLHSQSPKTMLKDQFFPVSIEAQLLGGLSDGKPRSTMNVCNPGIDVVYEGAILREDNPAFRSRLKTSDCPSASSKTFDGDQWVRVEMRVLGSGPITHFVNGEKVLEYSLPQYQSSIEKNFGLKGAIAGQLVESGYIALQSESHPIEFRKIELLGDGCRCRGYRGYLMDIDST